MRPLLLLPLLLLLGCPMRDDDDDDSAAADDDDVSDDDDAAIACGSGGSGGPIGESDGPAGVYSYRVLVPDSYDGSEPVPLMVGLHGAYGTGQVMTGIWRDVAQAEGFIVVGPDSGNTTGWNTSSDIDRIFAIVEQVTLDYDVDRCRIYLSGFSSGAHLTYVVGLGWSDVFAALAPYAGSMSYAEQLGIWPDEVARQVPFRIDHGSDDTAIPIGESEHARDQLEAAGHPVDYHPVPSSGHTWEDAFTDDIWASLSAYALDSPAELPER